MKMLKLFKDFINESKNNKTAILKIEALPNGSIFDDAKRIDGIFKKTKHSWSEAVEAFEKNKKDATTKSVNIEEIRVTQRNIQSNKVKDLISRDSELKTINAVQFPDELVIYDGHHRLTALWALGETKIKVNLVKI